MVSSGGDSGSGRDGVQRSIEGVEQSSMVGSENHRVFIGILITDSNKNGNKE